MESNDHRVGFWRRTRKQPPAGCRLTEWMNVGKLEGKGGENNTEWTKWMENII